MNSYIANHGDNAFDRFAAYVMSNNHYLCILDSFSTGLFRFHQPLIIDHNHKNDLAVKSLDMIGVSFSRVHNVKFFANMEMFVVDQEVKRSPEGLYYAAKDVSSLNVPIYISSYLPQSYSEESEYAVSKAISDGFDVRGYIIEAL
jgi:hypothetical protein